MKCKICNNDSYQVYNGPLRRYYDKEMNKPHVEVLNCNTCNISFLSKTLISKNYYDGEYYKHSKKMPIESKRVNEAKQWHDKLKSLNIKVEDGSRILGFGAGTGDFESLFNEQIIIDTVEPDKYIRDKFLQFCNKNYTTIQDCPNENYNYIFSFDTLEHIENLEQTVAQLYKKLLPKGIVVIGVPNLNDLYLDIFPNYKSHFYHHEHVWYMSNEFLNKLLSRYQFKVLNICGLHKYDLNNFLKWSKDSENKLDKIENIDDRANDKWREYLEKHKISSHIMIVGRK